jgi:hypothetical protein
MNMCDAAGTRLTIDVATTATTGVGTPTDVIIRRSPAPFVLKEINKKMSGDPEEGMITYVSVPPRMSGPPTRALIFLLIVVKL